MGKMRFDYFGVGMGWNEMSGKFGRRLVDLVGFPFSFHN